MYAASGFAVARREAALTLKRFLEQETVPQLFLWLDAINPGTSPKGQIDFPMSRELI
jgi:hypothetical protein